MPERPDLVPSHLQWLSKEYHELNGTHYETLPRPPTALEFSRLVHISRPVVIHGFKVPATRLWNNEYLLERMRDRNVSVAVTPNGRADAVTRAPDGKLYFVEPHVQEMPLDDFMATLTGDSGTSSSLHETHYLQSQNGNLYSALSFGGDPEYDGSEFEPLRSDVPREVPSCSKAFDRPPDAVNLWIGNSKSVTSIHSDPYENIYTVVRGTKHFTLLPPTEGWCLQERTYPHATYTRSSPASPLYITPSSSPPVRWSSVADPDRPGVLPPEAHSIHIDLHAGETLYLPAGWWHHVRQSGDITIALNWWYDVETQGMQWVWLSFLRGVGDVPEGNVPETTGSKETDDSLEAIWKGQLLPCEYL
ncbi:hypothetical protein PLICRDRAFT_34019 [Plicaturopsis crispa FD-325 SS-3]|nr:hypothetical protein PLICRDRAFT_34019 [Plicaturopsis crispa FD-325 SS-3]